MNELKHRVIDLDAIYKWVDAIREEHAPDLHCTYPGGPCGSSPCDWPVAADELEALAARVGELEAATGEGSR